MKTPQQIRNEVEKKKKFKLKINENCYLIRDKYGVKLMIKDEYVLILGMFIVSKENPVSSANPKYLLTPQN